ncbi:MAG: tetratricopeptide repeat protein [Tannerella sp.]|jgi:tetratricopeptide (TPR) repeat protein|nr:tetratricopeptide repeat protein [Tannerella sp.]
MKRFLFISLFISSACVIAEAQIPLHGTVATMQNNRTGARVSNAQIESPVAQPTTSDNNGRFLLRVSGVQMGHRAPLYVFPQNDYQGYVVVNEKDLKEHTLGADTVNVYICKADELDKQKAELVDLNLNNYVEKKQYDRIRKRLQQELTEVKSRSDRYREIIDSLSRISDDEGRMLKVMEEYADRLVRVNLDDIRDDDAVGVSRRKAFECALRGELDSVMFYMRDRIQLLHEAQEKKREAQKVQEAARQLEAAAKTAEQQQVEKINELIKDVMLRAQTAKAQNNHAEAEKCYLEAVNADSLNYNNIFEFAGYLYEIHEYAKAEKYYQYLLQHYEKLAKADPKVYLPDLAGILNNIGNNYSDQHEYSQAEAYYLRCLEIYEQISQENPKVYLPDLAMILNNIGSNYKDQHEYSQAEAYFLRCLEIREQMSQENPKVYLPDLATILNGIGINYNAQHEYSQAEAYSLRCLEIQEQLAQENPKVYLPYLAMILNNIGVNYSTQHEYSQAETYYLRCLEIQEQMSQENPKVYLPDLATMLNHIGGNYNDQHEYSQAEAYFLRCLGIMEQLSQENPKVYLPGLAWILNSIGANYNDQHEYSQAKEYFLKCIKIREPLYNDNPAVYAVDFYNILYNLARTCSQLEDYPSAIQYLSYSVELLDRHQEQFQQYNSKLTFACGSLSWYYLFTQEYPLSEQSARKGLDADPSQVWIKTNLAHALLFQSRFAEAETIYQELSQTIYKNNETFTQALLDDFDALEKAGAIPEERKQDVEKIRTMLRTNQQNRKQ